MPKIWRTGHVVVPKALHERYGIHAGDEVEITERAGCIVIRKLRAGRSCATRVAPRSGS